MLSLDSLAGKAFIHILGYVSFHVSTRKFVSNIYPFSFLLGGWNTLYCGLQTLSFLSTPSFEAHIFDFGI